jgi:soluble lytic murein transglycosylase-like protein
MSLPASAARPVATTVSAGGYAVDAKVLSGIRRASAATGIDFGYLMAQAAQESGFRSDARATTSSASGLYQFIESTWLTMVRDHGARHGAGDLARAIETGPKGEARVSDPAVKQRILDLREDARLSAALGAEYARENKATLEGALGREATGTDLYLAHFLGPRGAVQLLQAIDQNGNKAAADLLPKAAAANPSIFYDAEGNARTVRELKRLLGDKIERRTAAFDGIDGGGAAVAYQGMYQGISPRPPTVANAFGLPKLSVLSVLALSAYEILTAKEEAAKQGDNDQKRSPFV